MEKAMTLLYRATCLVAGALISIPIFIFVEYQRKVITDMPYHCAVQLVYLRFACDLLFLLPLFIFVHHYFTSARKWWIAFIMGGLWLPLLIINPIPSSHASVLISFSNSVVTVVTDFMLVVGGSNVVAVMRRG
jgi:hypothetical protein